MQKPVEWVYGITAVPQRVDTLLPQTLQSLAEAGFDRPYVFIDGFCDKSLDHPKELVIEHPHIGHLPNWFTALTFLYSVSQTANRFALFEDDLLAVKQLREYLTLMPYQENCYYNLLTHHQNLVLTGCKKGWHESNQKGRGAVGLVFNREAVRAILSSDALHETLFQPHRRCADGMVCGALKKAEFTELVHYPTLLQHTGKQSSLGHAYGEVPRFKPDYDYLSLLAKASA